VQDLHALFTGEDDTWEAWLVFDTGPNIGSNTIKLRRGFSPSESASTNPSQVPCCCFLLPLSIQCFQNLQVDAFTFFYSKRKLKS
jgi:hypothetical protein